MGKTLEEWEEREEGKTERKTNPIFQDTSQMPPPRSIHNHGLNSLTLKATKKSSEVIVSIHSYLQSFTGSSE